MPPSIPLVTKIKAQLKLAIARLRMVQQRDESASKAARRGMAQLLEQGKIESARIRVENIIRTDILTELHEILELYCELLLARAGLLDGSGLGCDPGLEEAVKSIMYAAPKTEIKELQTVRALLGERYGKEFVVAAMDNADGKVSVRVLRKLEVSPPREELVHGYLEEIAKTYGVDWPRGRLRAEAAAATAAAPTAPAGTPPEFCDDAARRGKDGGAGGGDGGDIMQSVETDEDDDDGGGGGGGGGLPLPATAGSGAREEELMRATPPRTLGGPASPVTVTPPRMTTDNVHPKVTLNAMELKPTKKAGMSAARGKGGADDGKSGVEELERRFAALKKIG